MKKLLNFSFRSSAIEVKFGRFTFELLLIKVLLSIKSFFGSYPHSSTFIKYKYFSSNSSALTFFLGGV